jgi:DNA polymerase elongation subunit (family B)
VLADRSIAAANDDLGVVPRLVGTLLGEAENEGAQVLASAAYPYLASQGLFSDPRAATDATAITREYIDVVLGDVRRRGGQVIEVDGEQIVFGTPAEWTRAIEHEVAEAARAYLPSGVELSYTGHYEALYARAPGTAMTLGQDGSVTLVGPAFRAGRLERFGEGFMRRAALAVLRGDVVGLRADFLETVHQLRTNQVPLEDLCVQVTLHKSLQQYRRGGTHEEPYEVLLAAAIRSWRVGQRIRYFRARGGEPRLLQEGDGLTSDEADTEYYVQRLCALYCQQFAQAFRREDFARIFRLPAGVGPFEEPDLAADLAHLRVIAEPVA